MCEGVKIFKFAKEVLNSKRKVIYNNFIISCINNCYFYNN